MTLGESFRAIRDHAKMNLREFAERLGISHVHVCNIENSKAMPSVELLEKVWAEFELDPYVLMALSQGEEVEKYHELLARKG